MKKFKYLIIGGGIAADAAVRGIRQKDEAGDIGIITAEKDSPYARPALSKDLWTGKKSIEDIKYNTESKGAEIVKDRRVVSLDIGQKNVADNMGENYSYEMLLLATGGDPRTIAAGNGDIIYFRNLEDYRHLRELASQKEHFAVLGGGFIGAEISAALCSNGNKVTMVFPEAAVCGLSLPSEFASKLTSYYESKGISVITGRKPSEIDTKDGVSAICLENGHKFSVDGVVAGVGISPNSAVAERSGINVDDGIVVDAQLRTSVLNVFAAGDVANFHHKALDKRVRVEHEDNALKMGEMAGRNMAGENEPYNHTPFFYSDLFDLGYEAVGEVNSSLETFTELRDPSEKGWIFYLKDNRVRGIVFWNIFDKVDAGRELISTASSSTRSELKAWAKERLSD